MAKKTCSLTPHDDEKQNLFKRPKTHEQSGDQLTYYFKNGKIKAEGRLVR